jgi:hypothetical protein
VLYEPPIIAFILVAIVGGLAVIMGISADWELSHELSHATDRWTQPVVVRRYEDGPSGRERAAREAALLRAHGYQSSGPGFPNAPRAGQTALVTYVLVSAD